MLYRNNRNQLIYLQTIAIGRYHGLRLGIVLGILCCLLCHSATAAQQHRAGTTYIPRTGEPSLARKHYPAELIQLSHGYRNPFLHRLASGLKIRGIKLFDKIYLTRRKQVSQGNIKALGISYAANNVLYYFSPQLLSISFRY